MAPNGIPLGHDSYILFSHVAGFCDMMPFGPDHRRRFYRPGGMSHVASVLQGVAGSLCKTAEFLGIRCDKPRHEKGHERGL
jgi:hypothetical protein